MKFAPILLFVYNRLWHTKQTIGALQKNELACQSDLIIYSDGAKKPDDIAKVKEIRCYSKSVSGFRSIRVVEREKNYGLAENIISGVTEIVNQHGKVIVLEDDLVTSSFFLNYMNAGLELYENDEDVISIHGYMYPVKKRLPETFFIKGADCWGWATWKRGWDLFNCNGQELLEMILSRKKEKEFDFNNSYPYVQMLKDQIAGKNNSWAVRWYASAFLADKLTLYPSRSLVNNIGFDGSGSHCGTGEKFNSMVTSKQVSVNKTIAIENSYAKKMMANYLKRTSEKQIIKMIKKIIKVVKRITTGKK